MKLHEHEAAEIFSTFGIRTPEGALCATTDESVLAAEKIGLPVVLKAQVLTGGRGLAGGVKMAGSYEEVRSGATSLLNSTLRGNRVGKILVVPRIDYYQELYLGITIDGFSGCPTIMASSRGGMNIEEVARLVPGEILSLQIDVERGLFAFEARKLLTEAGFPAKQIQDCADTVLRLYRVFQQYDALVAEINPLVVCSDEKLMALDAKLEIDDSSLFRTGRRLPGDRDRGASILERLGRETGVTYVELDGDIGIISSGAGLGMATMDIIGQRMQPANFLETGGGITEELLYNTMHLVLKKKGLRAVFINLYGGINPIHEGAKGIVRYLREHEVRIPVVAKALGNRQEETWDILCSGGVHVVTDVATESAVEKLIELLRQRNS
ncbi:MAG: succinate--CoA ligase subunit beta [Syntrophobacterales bacterium]|nr:succinate--CoA ligase subunit beta [Syntrophobacterales bacterium]